MDGFTYHDIFQTKGIEYLVIIGFLLLLIPFWMIINKKAEIIRKIKALGTLTLDILNIPRGVIFGKNHTWAHLEKSGIAEVGLDDLVLHLTGEVNYRISKDNGDFIRKGELLAEVMKDGKALRIFSPISGKIVDSNKALEENPVVSGESNYSRGWVYKIEPTNWITETSSGYQGEEAMKWFRKELERFKDFIAVVAAKNSPEETRIVLQEGGEVRDNTLSEFPDDIWQDFQKEFLDT